MLASFHHHTPLMTCRLQGILSCWTSFHFPTLWPSLVLSFSEDQVFMTPLKSLPASSLSTTSPSSKLKIIIKLRLAFYLGWGWPGRRTLLQSRRNEDLQAERREERGHQPFLFSCPVIHFIKAGVSGISFSSIIRFNIFKLSNHWEAVTGCYLTT